VKRSQLTIMMKAPKSVLTFLKEHALKGSNLRIHKVSDSQFWLETLDKFISARFVVDENVRAIFYDIFSPKYDAHLKEATLTDVEKLDSTIEIMGKWRYEKSIEDLWFALDWIKVWARENGFHIVITTLI
jgi:hypothetical protein